MTKMVLNSIVFLFLSSFAHAGNIIKCEPSVDNELSEAGVELLIDFNIATVYIFSLAGLDVVECKKTDSDFVLHCTVEDGLLAGTAVMNYDQLHNELNISNGIGSFNCVD